MSQQDMDFVVAQSAWPTFNVAALSRNIAMLTTRLPLVAKHTNMSNFSTASLPV